MSRRERIDVKELLKRDAYGDAPGCDTHAEKSRPCPTAVYGASDQYVMLDSFVKLRESRTAQGEYRWNFMVQGVTGDEVVGVRDRIDTVVEMQMGSFAMPMLPDVPYVVGEGGISEEAPFTDGATPPFLGIYSHPPPPSSVAFNLVPNNTNHALGPPSLIHTNAPYGQYPHSALLPARTSTHPWTHNPYSQTPFFGALTVQVREAGLQSFSDRDGARHHFEYRISPGADVPGANPNMALAKPMCGDLWDTYTFTDPLRDIHGITLVFRNPDVPIRFDPDILYNVAASYNGDSCLRFYAPGHALNAGDRVFIRGFTTAMSTLNAYINRVEGHVVGGEPTNGSGTSVTPLAPGVAITGDYIYLDPTVVVTPPPAHDTRHTIDIYVAKRRLRIPVRFRRVIDRLTNYKSV